MQSETQNQQETDFFVPTEQGAAVDSAEISWTASEFMHHTKSFGWYMGLAGAVALIAALVFLFTREYFAPGAVVIFGLIFGYLASRKPRDMHYSVGEEGVTIGKRLYIYDDFQSFTVLNEDGIESIMLIPQKRWMPALTMYFDPAQADTVFNVLGTYLPFEEREKDPIDKFLHRIRF